MSEEATLDRESKGMYSLMTTGGGESKGELVNSTTLRTGQTGKRRMRNKLTLA
jgi:hypothetical protein